MRERTNAWAPHALHNNSLARTGVFIKRMIQTAHECPFAHAPGDTSRSVTAMSSVFEPDDFLLPPTVPQLAQLSKSGGISTPTPGSGGTPGDMFRFTKVATPPAITRIRSSSASSTTSMPYMVSPMTVSPMRRQASSGTPPKRGSSLSRTASFRSELSTDVESFMSGSDVSNESVRRVDDIFWNVERVCAVVEDAVVICKNAFTVSLLDRVHPDVRDLLAPMVSQARYELEMTNLPGGDSFEDEDGGPVLSIGRLLRHSELKRVLDVVDARSMLAVLALQRIPWGDDETPRRKIDDDAAQDAFRSLWDASGYAVRAAEEVLDLDFLEAHVSLLASLKDMKRILKCKHRTIRGLMSSIAGFHGEMEALSARVRPVGDRSSERAACKGDALISRVQSSVRGAHEQCINLLKTEKSIRRDAVTFISDESGVRIIADKRDVASLWSPSLRRLRDTLRSDRIDLLEKEEGKWGERKKVERDEKYAWRAPAGAAVVVDDLPILVGGEEVRSGTGSAWLSSVEAAEAVRERIFSAIRRVDQHVEDKVDKIRTYQDRRMRSVESERAFKLRKIRDLLESETDDSSKTPVYTRVILATRAAVVDIAVCLNQTLADTQRFLSLV